MILKNYLPFLLLVPMLMFSIGCFSQVTLPNIDQFERSVPGNQIIITNPVTGIQEYRTLDDLRDSVAAEDTDWLALSGALNNTGTIYHQGRAIVGSTTTVGAFPNYTLGIKGGAVIEGLSSSQPNGLLDFQNLGGNRWSFQNVGQNFIIMPDVNGIFKIHGDGFGDVLDITTATGNIQAHQYPNTRDDSGTDTPINFIYSDANGNLRSSNLDEINSGEWVEQILLNTSSGTITTADPLPTNSGEVVVTVNGIEQMKGATNDYDFTGGSTTLTFNYALTSDHVKIRYLKK